MTRRRKSRSLSVKNVLNIVFRMKKKSSKQKVKLRIQKLLLEICRIRDKRCVLEGMGVGRCGGLTSADHILRRGISRTYAETDNVVCLCWYHHFQWKASNPTIYTELIRNIIGEARFQYIHQLAKEQKIYTEKDWLAEEEKLKLAYNNLKVEETHK